MRTTLHRLRRVATIALAAGAMTAAVGIPTASADDICGEAVGLSGVYMRACWNTTATSDGAVYRSEAKLRIGTPHEATGWTRCELRIAIFVKVPGSSSYQRARTVKTDCVQLFQAMSNAGTQAAVYVTDDYPFLPQPGYCYKVLTHWLATYKGTALDSPVASSSVKCGANRTADLNTDLGSGVVDTTETAPTLTLTPTLDVS
ncbi:MAG TPA: hypothetical protein VF519_09440 [Mycobacteriales bacterium]